MNNKMTKKSKVRVDMTNKWAIIKCNNNKDPNMKNSQGKGSKISESGCRTMIKSRLRSLICR